MSERTELEHQMAPEILRKDAPFGTDSTPTITMKIIGGRQVPVIEKHAIYNNDYAGSRIQPLRPIADKPNHLDPRIHGDNPEGYYYKDVQEIYSHPLEHKGFDFAKYYEELGDKPTNFANKRPDSKDVVRGQLKALPPIQQNRTRNDLSTVFESETWTDKKYPPLANDTEYKQNYFLGQELGNGMDDYQSGGGKDFHYVSESEQKSLSMLLPSNVLLPVDPIRLTREQETTLCKLICNELNRFDPQELRDVYIECSQHDKELRGFCGIEILDNCLRRHRAFLAHTLRLVAAQFVDPNYPGKVNYEKTLSLIGSALQLNAKGQLASRDRLSQPSNSHNTTPRDKGLYTAPKQDEMVETDKDIQTRSQERQPKYYMQNGETFKTGSIFRDREVAKLLRTVEQELSKNTYAIDWTRWQNSFYERDRDHRDTLSAAQIKDICYDHKLPLSDSLINHILNLCDDNNRDGQYRWPAFLEFLRRVRPSNTGLPIPVSKRPLEYARHYPEPVPNWPRTDADTERRGTSPRKDVPQRRNLSPQRLENKPDDRGQTPILRVPTPKEWNERRPEDNREASSPDRYRSPDRTPPQRLSYYDISPLPNLRLNSPSPSNRSLPPSPRNRYRPQHDVYPEMDNSNFNDKVEKDRNYNDMYNSYQHDYRGPRKDLDEGDKWNTQVYDRRRSFAERPSGYQPSWQQNVSQKRTNSPLSPRRPYGREPYNREERAEESPYERHWKSWAYKSNREPRGLQRVQSRYERPKSYADPPRKTSFPMLEEKRRRPYSYREEIRVPEQYHGRASSRLQTPLRRTQSLSPIRNMSPVRGQPNPYSYRESYGDLSHRDNYRQQYPYELMDAYKHRYNDRDDYQQRDGGNSYRKGNDGGRGDESHRSREHQIKQLSHQLHDLETQYEVTKQAASSRDKPWLDRYIKLAEALYNSDITNKGSLPRKDVMDLVDQYNNAFNLKLDMVRANMLAFSPENLDKSGNIILRSFLANLSADRITYKV